MAPRLVDDILALIYEFLSDQERDSVAFLNSLFLHRTLQRRYGSVIVCCQPKAHRWLYARLRDPFVAPLVRELVFRRCHTHRSLADDERVEENEDEHIMDIVDTVKGLQNVVRLVARETDVHSHQQGSLYHTISAIWPSIASRLQTVHVEALPYASSSVLCQDASLSNLEELKVSVCATSYGFVPAHAEGASYLPADLASFISAASTTLTTLHLSIPEQASVPDTGYDALFGTLVARSLPRLRNLHLCLAVIHGHSRTGLEGWLLALAPQLEHFSLLAQDCWRTSFSAVDYFALLAHIVPAMARLEHLGLAYPHKTAYYTTPDSHEAALAISGLLQTFRWAMSVGIQVVSISGRAFDLDDLHDALRFDQSRHSVCGTETPPIEQGCSDEQLHGILTTRFSRLIVEPKDAQPSDTVCGHCGERHQSTCQWTLQSLSLKRTYWARDAPLKGLDAMAIYSAR